jgi:hypothetical protein
MWQVAMKGWTVHMMGRREDKLPDKCGELLRKDGRNIKGREGQII